MLTDICSTADCFPGFGFVFFFSDIFIVTISWNALLCYYLFQWQVHIQVCFRLSEIYCVSWHSHRRVFFSLFLSTKQQICWLEHFVSFLIQIKRKVCSQMVPTRILLPCGSCIQHRHYSAFQNCSATSSGAQPVRRLITQICWEHFTTFTWSPLTLWEDLLWLMYSVWKKISKVLLL